MNSLTAALLVLLGSYLIGSIPFAYIIVKGVTGEDITQHGTGNIGSMNVRRTTGSWGWFVLAVLGDGMKGLVPVLVAKWLGGLPVLVPYSQGVVMAIQGGVTSLPAPTMWNGWIYLLANPLPWIAVFGSVVGHNYSIWVALIKHKGLSRTGKGLATGAGALLAYDWRYLLAVLLVGLLFIAVTRYMMAGQVAAAATLPIVAIATQSFDWPFALFMGLIVYAAHHKRFVGMLRGQEPKLYINDRMGPQG
ncbi:MAG: glycerol-3-phosphate acyltransferase [Coriobacteriia bacterium]|nr:glycerol-3-phosphate acyltransferase [Coriobacteriia bacterium]